MKKANTVRAQIGPFAMVPLWLLRRCRDARAIHLYAVIGAYANREGRAWPKRAQLAEDMGISVKSVERAIETLRGLDALRTARRHRADGAVAGLDFLLVQVDPELDQSDTHVAQDEANQSDTGVVQGCRLSDTRVRTKATPVSQLVPK